MKARRDSRAAADRALRAGCAARRRLVCSAGVPFLSVARKHPQVLRALLSTAAGVRRARGPSRKRGTTMRKRPDRSRIAMVDLPPAETNLAECPATLVEAMKPRKVGIGEAVLQGDVLEQVVNLAGPGCLPTLRLVSKQWRAAVDPLVTRLSAELDSSAPALRFFPGLTSLSLAHCRDLADEDLSMCRSLTALRSLDLSLRRQVTNRRHDRRVNVYRQLFSASAIPLDMHRGRFTEVGLAAVAELTTLRHLSLAGHDDLHRRHVAGLAPLLRLRSLDLSGCGRLANEALSPLGALAGLERLDLCDCARLSDAALHTLSGVGGLREVRLGGCKRVGEEGGLGALARLPCLTALDLRACSVTDEGLEALAAVGGLRELDLCECRQVTDRGAAALAAFPLLARLSLRGCKRITDDGLIAVGGLRSLTDLDLTNTDVWENSVTDRGVAAIAALTGLTSLDLSGCKHLSDAGVRSLAPLTALTALSLAHCYEVTDRGVAALAGLRQLAALDLSDCWHVAGWGLAGLGPSLPRLATLTLRKCRGLQDWGPAGLPTLTNLTSLCLTNCYQMTDRTLADLAAYTRLARLDLEDCHQVTDAGVAALAPLGASLTALDLSACVRLTDRGLHLLAPLTRLATLRLQGLEQVEDWAAPVLGARSTLEALSVAGCGRASPRSLAAVAGSNPRLQSLDLSACPRVTDRFAAALAACTALRTLSLAGCHQVGDEGAGALRGLGALTSLDLSRCRLLTDEGLAAALAPLPALARLTLVCCPQLTCRAVEGLPALTVVTCPHCADLRPYAHTDYASPHCRLVTVGDEGEGRQNRILHGMLRIMRTLGARINMGGPPELGAVGGEGDELPGDVVMEEAGDRPLEERGDRPRSPAGPAAPGPHAGAEPPAHDAPNDVRFMDEVNIILR